jgi:DNA sulfur modification protein DndE
VNLNFREDVWRAGFRPLAQVEEFEASLRAKLGLSTKYESARLSIGRSLAEPSSPSPVSSDAEKGKAIAGEYLFGTDVDLWIATVVVDGGLGASATADDFRSLVEAHWARGGRMLQSELENAGDDETRFMARLAELIPAEESGDGALPVGNPGEVRIPVGSVSKTHPGGEPIEISLNGLGAAPHHALMGRLGSGKTTTGVQIAAEIHRRAGIPFLFIDPKGEFVDRGQVAGRLAELDAHATAIEVGEQPIPLDFLPDPGVGSASVTKAAMQFRDSIALCCKGVGNIQQDLLRISVEKVIRHERPRDLKAVKEWYRQELQHANKDHDVVLSRLNELTTLKVFTPSMSAQEFFSRSWVISLKTLGTEELKRLVILLLLDSLKSFVLMQQDSPTPHGFRSLRHLLVIDEARRILSDKKYQSLVDLIRQGRSKGSVVMLLSQDPSDFEGQADDFTKQLGTVIAFACAQSQRGLKALQGAYGRRLQPNEFVDTYLPTGVAFAKLPGREPDRIRCWGDEPVATEEN